SAPSRAPPPPPSCPTRRSSDLHVSLQGAPPGTGGEDLVRCLVGERPGRSERLGQLLRRCQCSDPVGDVRHRHVPVLAVREVGVGDRKSTRLNSSHVSTSYAVFC